MSVSRTVLGSAVCDNLQLCDQCNGCWEIQSSVTCNSLCGARVNMKEGRPLMTSGRKTMNRICDNIKCTVQKCVVSKMF